jgi:hypothetical protein
VRELLGKSTSEKVSTTRAPIEFAENPQLPETATTPGTAESQSGPNLELTSLGERTLNVVGEGGNVDEERGVVEVEKAGQNLEDCNLDSEFPIFERQL